LEYPSLVSSFFLLSIFLARSPAPTTPAAASPALPGLFAAHVAALPIPLLAALPIFLAVSIPVFILSVIGPLTVPFVISIFSLLGTRGTSTSGFHLVKSPPVGWFFLHSALRLAASVNLMNS